MNKITELTPEQIAKFPQYVTEWVKRGLTTERRTQAEAEKVFTDFQRIVLNQANPAPVILLDSPEECWREVLRHLLLADAEVMAEIEREVKAGSNRDEVFEAVLNDSLAKIPVVYPYYDCQFWAGWFAFYEYCRIELGVKFDNMAEYNAMLASHTYGMVWPLDNACIVCQPPSILKRNERGLHCEDGPAVSFSGRNEIYSLNGIVVPRELVMTPSENLSLDFFKTVHSADVKAEFVRKYGVERMLDFGKKVDSFENYDETEYDWWHRSQYELWNMGALFDIEYQPYLKMMNQTTGIWHVEAVSPACRTLRDAIKERFGGREMKIKAIA